MRSPRRLERSSWGGRAVLVLVGIRLGLDGINPIYYGAVKVSTLLLYRPELIPPPIGTIHLSAIRWHCGRPPFIVVLFYGLSGRQPLLP